MSSVWSQCYVARKLGLHILPCTAASASFISLHVNVKAFMLKPATEWNVHVRDIPVNIKGVVKVRV